MELLDRDFQRLLLESLANEYPKWIQADNLPTADGNKRAVNIHYLEEHGLVEAKWLSFGELEPGLATITAKGIDFLQDDGGLGAILGTVTIRIHPDSVRDLLIERVESSDEDETVKKKVVDKLKSLPADALGEITKTGLKEGLKHVPNLAAVLWVWLQSQTS